MINVITEGGLNPLLRIRTHAEGLKSIWQSAFLMIYGEPYSERFLRAEWSSYRKFEAEDNQFAGKDHRGDHLYLPDDGGFYAF